MKLHVNCLWLLALTLSPLALAKTSDREQPMHIEADSVEINELKGISIYRGNVVIRRGSTVIKGNLIHIYQKNNAIERITIEGTPASFRQLNDQDQEVLAESQNMEYQNTEGILVMKKKALLVQHNNRFSSDQIIYNVRKDIVQAGSESKNNTDNGGDRVTITIQPEQPEQAEQTPTDNKKPQ